MIKNILLETSYDGTNFSGFQNQDDERTVEGEISKALFKVTGEKNRIIACGRTDRGVHAKSHFINFLTASDIAPKAFFFHIQPYLPEDILAISSKEVSLDFHARFMARQKTYRYIINTEKIMHPIFRNYMANISYKLDYKKLDQGLSLLKGNHDFRLFMKEDKDLRINTNRKIIDCFYIRKDNILSLYFTADSFLYNQVRIMAGSLIDLARGKLSINDYKNFFNPKESKRANPALTPAGLYLWEVKY